MLHVFLPETSQAASDSPFRGTSFSYFHLETFEDGLLNTPGVTASGGFPIGMDMYVDSVDIEDGVLDGSGSPNGHSFYSGFTEYALTFTFDGAEDRFFGAFHPGGISAIRIGTNSADWEVDDLQYGAVHAVPEPSTLLLMGLGTVSVSLARAVRRRQS